MSMDAREIRRPVRIELGTSEIDGGPCRAWADPAQVLAAVALSHPEDTFTRFVEPRLREPEPTEPERGELPGVVRALISRLQATHTRLFRENRSFMREARWVELTCVAAEEDRVYFVKTSPAWICLVREGRAHPAERSREEVPRGRASLGGGETLRLEVTSLAVRPGDIVVLLCSEMDTPPELRAVSSIFGQTVDLKRACDGLVNLLGLQSQGAAAVALRFVPVGPQAHFGPAENPLEGLSDDLTPNQPESSDVEWKSTPAPESFTVLQASAWTADLDHPSEEQDPLDDWDDAPLEDSPEDSLEDPAESSPDLEDAEIWRALAHLEPMASAVAPASNQAPEATIPDPVPTSPPLLAAAKHKSRWFAPAALLRGALARVNGGPRLRTKKLWGLILTLIGVGMVLLVALPGGMLSGTSRTGSAGVAAVETAAAEKGSIWVQPDPPARQVFLDGEPIAGGTPVRLDGVPVGHHRLALDLGPCGFWETDIRISSGSPLQFAPKVSGSIEVAAAVPSTSGKIWVQGGARIPVPGTLENLSVGWNRIFYEDDRIALWDRQVLVRSDRVARVVVPNHQLGERGQIRVESLVFRERQGMADSEGDSVWVDGTFAGLTPHEEEIVPGLHSVRVTSSTGDRYTELLEIRPGGARHVVAQLIQTGGTVLRHVPPGRVLVQGPLVLMVEVRGTDAEEVLQPTLHLPELEPASREVALISIDGSPGTFVGKIDASDLPAGRALAYYFSVRGSSGELVLSDLFRLLPERGWEPESEPQEPDLDQPAGETLPIGPEPPGSVPS